MDTEVDFAALFDAVPTPCLVLDPGLRIVALNAAHERVSGRRRQEVQGLHVLDAFPDVTPRRDARASDLELSLARVLRTLRPDTLPVYRYDIPDGSGGLQERWWSAVHLPVLGADGHLAFIMERVEDVTPYMRERSLTSGHDAADAADPEQVAAELARLQAAVADVYTRGQELHDAFDAEAATSRRLQGLVEVALQLGSAQTVAELTNVVIGAGFTVLGADDGAVALLTDDGDTLELAFSDAVGERTRTTYARVPLDAPLPVSVAAVTGRAVVLPDERSCREWGPELAAAIDLTGYRATVALPLRSGGKVLGALSTSWWQEQVFDQRDLDLMDAFAAQCAQTLHRIRSQERERRAAAAQRSLSESLQRSLLTRPHQPDGLHIAVRYLPAAAQAEVGGDWYDSFPLPSGLLTLVVGDVAGHDRDAAALMAQARNLLRGVSLTLQRPPAAVLTALDEAMHSLGTDTFTTVVLAHLERTPAGAWALHWSNAGHPPPVLLGPDGSARLLETTPDLVLGLDPGTPRADHRVDLEPGSTVVVYTDGLVERRDAPLQAGLEWLRGAVAGRQHLSAEQLCDHVLTGLHDVHEDDIALLVVRVEGVGEIPGAPTVEPR